MLLSSEGPLLIITQKLFLSSGRLKHTAVQYSSSHPGKAVYCLWSGYDQTAGGDSVKVLCWSTYFSLTAFVQPSSSSSLGLPVHVLHVLRSQIVKERYFSPRRAAKEGKGRAVEENCSRRLASAPVCIRPAAKCSLHSATATVGFGCS